MQSRGTCACYTAHCASCSRRRRAQAQAQAQGAATTAHGRGPHHARRAPAQRRSTHLTGQQRPNATWKEEELVCVASFMGCYGLLTQERVTRDQPAHSQSGKPPERPPTSRGYPGRPSHKHLTSCMGRDAVPPRGVCAMGKKVHAHAVLARHCTCLELTADKNGRRLGAGALGQRPLVGAQTPGSPEGRWGSPCLPDGIGSADRLDPGLFQER